MSREVLFAGDRQPHALAGVGEASDCFPRKRTSAPHAGGSRTNLVVGSAQLSDAFENVGGPGFAMGEDRATVGKVATVNVRICESSRAATLPVVAIPQSAPPHVLSDEHRALP